MTPDRFAALAEAYGSTLDRWPEAERTAAAAFLRAHPHAQAVLDRQAGLDARLAAWDVPGPGAALAASIMADVQRRRASWRRLRLWLSGFGAMATLAGGVAAGVGLVTVTLPATDQATAGLYDTSVLGAALDPGPNPGPNPGNRGQL